MLKIVGFSVLCLIWGTTWMAIKVSLEGLPPFLGAGIRFILSAVLLISIVLWKRINLRLSRREFGILFVSGILIYPVDYGLIYWAEQTISAGVTAIFFATLTLFTAIWSHFVFHNEPFRRKKFLGLLLGFSGIVIVFYDQLAITKFDLKVILSSLAVIVAAASGGLAVVLVKKNLDRMNSFKLTLTQLLFGLGFLLMVGLLAEDTASIQLNGRVAAAVVYLGTVGTAFAFVLYYRLLREMSAITISLIVYITPVIALIVDFIFLGEIIPLRSFIGMVVIFAGIGLNQIKFSPARP